jgi:hypothetical protein
VAVMLVHGEEEQNGEDRTQAVALQLSESERERDDTGLLLWVQAGRGERTHDTGPLGWTVVSGRMRSMGRRAAVRPREGGVD